MAYAFVEPEYIKGNGENIHIFQVRKDETGNIRGLSSRCGNEKLLSDWYEISICGSEKETRATSADLQNRGKNVCGQCVATFYSR